MRPIMVPDLLPATEEMKEKSVAVLKDLLQVKDFLSEDWRSHNLASGAL